MLDGIEAAVNQYKRKGGNSSSKGKGKGSGAAGLSYIRIDGRVDPAKRMEMVHKFQDEETCRVRPLCTGLLAVVCNEWC